MAIEPKQVVEALSMVTQQHLDIRTITLGLSLRGCVHEDIDVMAQRVYDRLTTAAKDLVPCAEPVSYTHLDVYKRQLHQGPLLQARGRCHG